MDTLIPPKTSFEMFAHEINDEFHHIYGSELQVRMCGDHKVVPVLVTFDDDGEYWGWFDFKRNHVSMIFKHFISLQVCFPYGIEIEEKMNKGIRKRLKIIKR